MHAGNGVLKIGHVHLKVRTLARSLPFYMDVLGLTLQERVNRYAFLSYGLEHHDVAINEVGVDAQLPTEKDVGLYHFAIETSSADQLKQFYHRLLNADVEVHPVDHGISKTLYFRDPDGNGIEVYLDTRKETGRVEWRGQSTDFEVDSL